MAERKTVRRVLLEHFFRRFFDNDTVQVEGDTRTTVVRALSAVSVPGLMVAFWLQTSYPGRTPEGVTHDRYFFMLLPFAVMGVVALFEWEMLFPDRLDFLVLSPLALKPREMLGAKAAALGIFLGMFLLATNAFGLLIYPLVSGGSMWHLFVAQGVAALMAGLFGVLVFLALGGVLLCVLSTAQFRVVSPVLQMVASCGLVLLVLHYVLVGDWMLAQLNAQVWAVRWMPPVWFLGVYERVLHGDAALPFAAEMAQRGLIATVAAAVVAAVTYPLAWVRVRRMAIEGSSGRGLRPWRGVERLVQLVVRRPGERAVFAFIGQTIARNNRYQVYLAMYCGIGIALAIACSVGFSVHAGQIHWSVSKDGLHAMTPLMMFWVVTGLRAAFGLPVNLQAGWIFRVTGVKLSECAAAARSWSMMCAMIVLVCILLVLWLLSWGARPLLAQTGAGFCVALLLTNAFFAEPDAVPFNKPRMPGKSKWALLLTLYFGVLPVFVFVMSDIETGVEKRWRRALWWCVATAAVWGLMVWRRRESPPLDDDWAEYSGEYLLLGLGQRS
jgi:hypothetical protein